MRGNGRTTRVATEAASATQHGFFVDVHIARHDREEDMRNLLVSKGADMDLIRFVLPGQPPRGPRASRVLYDDIYDDRMS